MSIDLLERATAALGDALLEKVVFVGAATLPLWITDPAAAPLRPTVDVDVVVEISTLPAYNRFEQRLRRAGFRDEGTVLGRFLHGDLQLDAIPAEASILGFENRWQRESLADAAKRSLPSGAAIRVFAPVNLLSTKLEAFSGRGGEDFLASPDFEDGVALLDGRESWLGRSSKPRPRFANTWRGSSPSTWAVPVPARRSESTWRSGPVDRSGRTPS